MANVNYTKPDWLTGFGGVGFVPGRGTHLDFARGPVQSRTPAP